MSKMLLLGLTLIVLLMSIFLISFGTTGNTPGLWWAGLLLLCIGGLIPPVTRYTFEDSDDGEETNQNE